MKPSSGRLKLPPVDQSVWTSIDRRHAAAGNPPFSAANLNMKEYSVGIRLSDRN
jgi:hypothetical protein